jgi:hypothetical protein
MPKVFATWIFTLKPGVSEEEFKRFVREWPLDPPTGTHPRILKGERGEGLGKYLMLNEFESLETRNSYFPARHTPVGEAEERMQRATMQKFMSFIGERQDADWVVIKE